MTDKELAEEITDLIMRAEEAIARKDKRDFVECMRSIRDVAYGWESEGEKRLLQNKEDDE